MSNTRSSEQNSRNNADDSPESQRVEPPDKTSNSPQRQGSQESHPSYQYQYTSHPYQAYQGQPNPSRALSYGGQSSERQYIQPTAYVQPYPPPPYMSQQQSTQAYQSYPQNTGQPGQQFTGQPGQQYTGQPGQEYTGQPGQEYTGQPGQQYTGQPGQQNIGHAGPPAYYVSTSPNVSYMMQYPPPPRDLKSSPRVRPGGRQNRTEEELEGWTGFQDKKVRSVFVRKVYTILMLQLLFTMGIIALFIFEPNVKRFVQENKFVYFMALAIFVAVYLGIACCQSVRRKFPTNIIVLVIFTMAMSYMLGTISSFHNTEAVLLAVGICAAVCLFVTLFSFYSKFDFTSCGGVLCILLLVLLLFGIIAIFFPSKIMTMIYAGLGAVVFSLFLAYDTQMMMGGKQYELSPEEHIFAAVQLYIDIVYIFLFILILIGGNE